MKVIQIILISFGFFMVLFGYLTVKARRLKYKTIIFAYVAGVSLIILSIFPSISSNVADTFGVGRGVDIIVYFSITALIYLFFIVYEKIEEQNKKLTNLAREFAILNAKKKETKKHDSEKSEKK